MGNHEDEKQEEGTKKKVQTAIVCSLQFGGKRSQLQMNNLQMVHQTFCRL